MNVYRKSLVVQMMLFMIFFIIGANVIINHYLRESMPWIAYIIVGLLVVFGVLGFVYYRKPDERVSVVTPKEMKIIRYMLYGYFGIYILQMILSSVGTINLEILNITVGVVLMLIAVYGMYIQYRIIKNK